MISDKEFLKVSEVIKKIKFALKNEQSFSFVRIGDGENLILSQKTILSMNKIMKQSWAKKANKGQKGVTLPNLILRDQMVEAIKKADLIGIPFKKDKLIRTESWKKRQLTNRVFKYYKIKPKLCCHTFVSRVLPQKKSFWKALKGKQIMIVSNWAEPLKKILEKKPYRLNVPITLPFSHYNQMEETLTTISGLQNEFDIALVSCGVNAVVLTQKIAELTGKVAIDFGHSAEYMVKKQAGLGYSSSRANKYMLT